MDEIFIEYDRADFVSHDRDFSKKVFRILGRKVGYGKGGVVHQIIGVAKLVSVRTITEIEINENWMSFKTSSGTRSEGCLNRSSTDSKKLGSNRFRLRFATTCDAKPCKPSLRLPRPNGSLLTTAPLSVSLRAYAPPGSPALAHAVYSKPQ